MDRNAPEFRFTNKKKYIIPVRKKLFVYKYTYVCVFQKNVSAMRSGSENFPFWALISVLRFWFTLASVLPIFFIIVLKCLKNCSYLSTALLIFYKIISIVPNVWYDTWKYIKISPESRKCCFEIWNVLKVNTWISG